MFQTILIANRGEIACRIIKTARAMGIRTVAIYSSVDKDALHVKLADLAFCVGDAPAKDSYLNIERILEIAKKSQAQAINPGYGFLSENPKFAKACADANVVFIGPSVEAIEAMASKQLAKQRLESTRVPLTPGYHGKEQAEPQLLQAAKKMGFPILIKAANGGGGKGMRAVHQEAEFSAALAGAKREATASFADDTVILEKLLINPRHIEVQIMADAHGNVVSLFERDCSIQRRHQKIIEEAPAVGLSSSLRKNLAKAACEVAQSINYTGAGTVEFLVEANDNFYFMEMNTRLQVEHPVTELITGLDLVAWQIKIAAGLPLPLTQNEIKASGHAMECRIYAEDPFHGFVPSIGQIDYLKEPVGEGIRIDSGIGLHSRISKHYDPMIAKLIVFGENRNEALQKMQAALREYCIAGLKTNIPFLQTICQHPKFIKAEISTDFLDKETISLTQPDTQLTLLMTVGFDYLMTVQSLPDALFQDCFAWQLNSNRSWTCRYQDEDEVIAVLIQAINANRLIVHLKDTAYSMEVRMMEDKLWVEINKQCHQAYVFNQKNKLTLFTENGATSISRFNWSSMETQTQTGQLTAPMPSTVVAILKQVGDAVKAGEGLIVLEAMKMEHTVHAPRDGVLSEIFYPIGSQVDEGAQLLALSL